MTVVLAFVILFAPFAIAALLSWACHRNDAMRSSLLNEYDHPDFHRVQHDADAARTRFEQNPKWPASGVHGERR